MLVFILILFFYFSFIIIYPVHIWAFAHSVNCIIQFKWIAHTQTLNRNSGVDKGRRDIQYVCVHAHTRHTHSAAEGKQSQFQNPKYLQCGAACTHFVASLPCIYCFHSTFFLFFLWLVVKNEEREGKRERESVTLNWIQNCNPKEICLSDYSNRMWNTEETETASAQRKFALIQILSLSVYGLGHTDFFPFLSKKRDERKEPKNKMCIEINDNTFT